MNQRETAYNSLRDAIAYGEMKPGERLVEKKVCETYNLGRTPVREALSQLQIEGYLDFTPNQGFSVSKMSIESVREIYDVIAVLEGHAIKAAAKRITEEELRELERIQKSLWKAVCAKDQKAWVEHNSAFHEVLTKAGRNQCLSSLIGNLRRRVYRYRMIAIAIPNSLEDNFRAHERLVEALRERDASRAGKAMQDHVLDVSQKSISFMRQVPGI